MTTVDAIALFLLAALILYVLLGGADFGGGFWDLLASGPRKEKQRALIDHAIAPVWEANHVWLILVLVLLFSCFPDAFFRMAIALHLPLTFLLVGIVLRGAAFIFRHYGTGEVGDRRRWGGIFAVTSTITPLFLGIVIGSFAQGLVWFTPFAISVGIFTLTIFAYLAAVYLTNETDDFELQDDFRKRALYAAGAVAVMAIVVAVLARESFTRVGWPLFIPGVTLLAAGVAIRALCRRNFPLARRAAVAQVVGILVGWAVAQYPFLILPDVTLAKAAAPAATLRLILIALALGSILLCPSLVWLMLVFKGERKTKRETS